MKDANDEDWPDFPSVAEFVTMNDGIPLRESQRYFDGHYPQASRKTAMGDRRYLIEDDEYDYASWWDSGLLGVE